MAKPHRKRAEPDDAREEALARNMLNELLTDFSDPAALEQWLLQLTAGPDAIETLRKYKVPPVGFREFICSPYYMDAADVLWPAVIDAGEEMNNGQYTEAILTGGIGVAKTTLALYSQAYQLYLLSLLRSPHKEFDLDPASEIAIIFQSKSGILAKAVDYMRFRRMVERSPYFVENFSFRRDYESELHFPNNIVVRPVSGDDSGAIGQNVIGGVIDEINFMITVQNSTRQGDKGVYDQAESNYNALARRRESRFMQKGALPGLVCLVSSRNRPGQFTDRKEEERLRQIAEKGFTTVYLYDKRLWEIRPERYSGETFKVYLGDAASQPRVLFEGEIVAESEKERVMDVPVEHRTSFENDILKAIRDIAGQSTYAMRPFIGNPDKVKAAFGRHVSILSQQRADFLETRVDIDPKLFDRPKEPRAVHIDLGTTGDSAGVSCGFVPGFERMKRDEGVIEVLPRIKLDFVLEVPPPRNGSIIFSKIRSLIYTLRDVCGLNIVWVTLDSFQSTDTIQLMQAKGFRAAIEGLDGPRKTAPYEMTKTTILDGRLEAPEHARAQTELIRLERDPVTQNADHPADGSKDCADAICGVVWCLTRRRDIWAKHGVLKYVPAKLLGTE